MATDQYTLLNNNGDMPIKLAAIEAVQALSDIDEDLFFEAFDFLEKKNNAKMFIAMNANLRSRWLRRKLWSPSMKILLKTIYGKTIVVKVSAFITIEELKVKLYEKEAYLPTKVRFICAGKELENGRSLSDYNITDGSTIHTLFRVCGC
ncbi:polyubiquitin-like [Cucumis melo var. makuwa]|uniref:Polyubiquitin-like n=1 Tax=Cucumis melo var. makuwa TaxID=1194695 RepID=A0A5A7SML9_CUCMM|nr:polyubiquitin-like [Cucumis melo var. makuwa]TYK00384.1 polyubiquitin-like [Cucumis melo var. makuwa]